MYARTGTLYEVGLQSFGEEVLFDSLKRAAFVFHTTMVNAMVRENVAFVQGSGLDVIIEIFGLHYDADTLRSTFFRWGQQSQSSCAITHTGSLTAV